MHELHIENLSSEAEGVGRYEGIAVFVPGALPGERVRVRFIKRHRHFIRAELIEILQPAKNRQKAICPLFGRCGGCQLMHASNQEALKRQRVADAIERIGGLPSRVVRPCIPSPEPLHYRNKIFLPILETPHGKYLGLYAKGSHEIVPVKHCFIHAPLGQRVLERVAPLIRHTPVPLRHLMIRSGPTSNGVLLLLSSWAGVDREMRQLSDMIMAACPEVAGVLHQKNAEENNTLLKPPFTLLTGQNFIEEELLGVRFRISIPSFFQVNPKQAANLYRAVLAHVHEGARVIDAFCGVGTLSLILAKQVHSVVGIECVPEAIADANASAVRNAITNATFLLGRVEERLPECPPADLVILNPPRKGCERSVLETLSKHPPKTLLYISCDPATLARDLKELVRLGFDCKSIQPFDMFPQTMHVESLAYLKLS